jgi:hypothetical protein
MPPTRSFSVTQTFFSFAEEEVICLVTIAVLFAVVCFLRVWLLKRKLVGSLPWMSLKGFSVDNKNHRCTMMTIFLFILCIGRGYACLTPFSDNTYRLIEGHYICFPGRNIEIPDMHYTLGVSYVYDTVSFTSETGSSKGCIQGTLCGSHDDCAAWSPGKVVEEGRRHYKKTCIEVEPVITEIVCFFYNACILWTQSLNFLDTYKVYRIAHGVFHFPAIQSCHYVIEDSPAMILHDKYLVRGNGISYICVSASALLDPRHNTLGDVQMINGTVYHDWGWGCPHSNIRSRGECNIMESFMISPDCAKLPGIIEEYYVEDANGRLVVKPTQGWRATLECSEKIVQDANETCHDPIVKLTGMEGMDNDAISIKVMGHSDGIATLNVSCYEGFIEVQCDDNWHEYPMLTQSKCFFNGKEVDDTRTMVTLINKDPHVTVINASDWTYRTVIIAMSVIIFVILIKIAKMILC